MDRLKVKRPLKSLIYLGKSDNGNVFLNALNKMLPPSILSLEAKIKLQCLNFIFPQVECSVNTVHKGVSERLILL